ncbi:hypothetical protein ACH79_39490 [Bradyrhizobium sp. CCBAU 051011]|uniref:hypothetical protein n=1 Tax=Bradyrhizobium sp. CCBAU 051011 TaxID=858422 RepID=UPI001373D402|nr:hypothetical protein [Bradyrhizobium sp. CCBAU 051011]QHO77790.1 hypothetical protein ACH79_39490 [Bradyrhizobium sp. CCBAU 051011]
MNTLLVAILTISGAFMVLAGTVMLVALAVQALAASVKAARSTEAAAVDADGVAKVLKMLSKLPQWFLAILTGNFQLWLALRTFAGQSWWPS